MQDETSRAARPERGDVRHVVLALLLAARRTSGRGCRVRSNSRSATGSRLSTRCDQLYAEGLVHRLGDFVFATRAAVNMERIAP